MEYMDEQGCFHNVKAPPQRPDPLPPITAAKQGVSVVYRNGGYAWYRAQRGPVAVEASADGYRPEGLVHDLTTSWSTIAATDGERIIPRQAIEDRVGDAERKHHAACYTYATQLAAWYDQYIMPLRGRRDIQMDWELKEAVAQLPKPWRP